MSKRYACLAVVFALCATGAPAREVYKCTNAQGDVAFQDKPCARQETELIVHIAEESEYAPAPAPVVESPAPAPPPPAPAPLKRPLKPLPPLWVCMNAEDGSRYISRNGAPPPRLVPLGVLGYPPKTLAEAYPPGATNRMSAPEMSKVPIDTSARASVGAGYTQIQDECVTLNRDQTCEVLHQELDQLNDKLARARFKDEQAKFGAEIADIEKDLGGCPN